MLRYGYTTTAANDLPPVDYAAIARAFGVASASVDGVGSEYAQVLARAVASRVPWLLHVRARLHPPATTTPFWPMKSTT